MNPRKASFKGKHHSPETKAKLSKIMKGRSAPWQKGKVFTAEHRLNLSTAHKGYKPSEATRLKMSLKRRKEKHPNWKGGITPAHLLLRKSKEYKIWREAVFKRDNWTCIWCGEKGYLQADHIKPFSLFPELRLAIDNGRTLCVPCHKKTGTWGYSALKFKE